MLCRAEGRVISIDIARRNALEITVEIDGDKSRAIAYTNLIGEVHVGDILLLNTTAVVKRLGTGGFHFAIANLSRQEIEDCSDSGHIVKCRYTPVQHSVLSIEEDESEYKNKINKFESLNGMPVVVGQLHSQIAPAAAAIKQLSRNRAKIVYIMTDTASLAYDFSRLAHQLRNHNLIDTSITCGQAFGADYEAVNIYTALIAAKEALKCDCAIVCPGPGNVGTGTKYGFSSLDMGNIINAVNILGGQSIAIARISFADLRLRHNGLSHHTITALSDVALTKCTLALPMIDQMKLVSIQEQIMHTSISHKHKVRIFDGKPGIMMLQSKNIEMKSMGRSYQEDPEFFLAASAAGAGAVELLKGAI